MDARPNHTVYINNLNEKVKKEGESFPFHKNSETYDERKFMGLSR